MANKRFSSIHTRLFVSVSVLIAIIITIIGLATYRISGTIIEKEVAKSRLQVLKQVSRNINTIAFQMVSISNLYYFDKELADILKSDVNIDSYQKRIQYNTVMNKFIQYTYSFMDQDYNCILLGFNGKTYSQDEVSEYNLSDIINMPWYTELLEKDGKILWTNNYDSDKSMSPSGNILSAVRLLNDQNNRRPYGILLLNMDEEVLYNAYSSAVTGDNIMYIVDADNNIISHSNKELLGKKSDIHEMNISGNHGNFVKYDNENNKVLYSYYYVPELGWTIAEEISYKVLLEPLVNIEYLNYFLMVLCLLLGLVMTFLIARKITYPVKQLCGTMKEVKQGNFDVESGLKGPSEIRELSEGFDSMVLTIKDLMLSIREEEKLKRRAELDFLQAQINPHFLYNTLNSVKCMVSIGQNQAAEKMLISFIRLLRKTLENEDEYVTISEELSNLDDYVSIQKVRYPDKFEIEYAASPEVLECKVPKLIIQPLVENAIFHGVEPKKNKGHIKITVEEKNNNLYITVMDDGVGMSDQQIKMLLKGKKSFERTFNRIGVFNVNERIMLNYGVEYGLSIKSMVNKGTTIVLKLPCIR